MSKQSMVKVLPGLLLLMGNLSVRHVEAQSVCAGPFLGQGSPQEVCVNISSGGASIDRRGPSGFSVNEIVGEYEVDLRFAFASNPTGASVTASGHALVITGTVTRMTAGNLGLSVTADGGLGPPLSIPANGLLSLIGAATDTSNVQFGGGAGFLFQNTLDLEFVSIGNVACDVSTLQAGGLGCELDELPIANNEKPIVAIRNILGLHLNNVGEMITLPAGAVAGDAPVVGEDGGKVLEYEVEGRMEHFPEDQFRIVGVDAGCPPGPFGTGEHYHLQGATATSLEGSTITDPDPSGCGIGYVGVVPTSDLSEIDEDTELPYSQCIDDQQAVSVGSVAAAPSSRISPLGSSATLTIADVLALAIADGGALIVRDRLEALGTLRIETGGLLNNVGTIDNTGNTINNFGILNNSGTINNTGTITNECGGVINNTGTITGSPIVEIPCDPLYFAQLGNGQGLTSSVVLANASDVGTASGNLSFLGDDGLPLPLGIVAANLNGVRLAQGILPSGPTDNVDFSIPPLSVLTISTDGEGDLTPGSALVASDQPLGGVIRFRIPDIGIAGVGTSAALSRFIVPVRRNAGGINTGIAIRNTEDIPVTLRLTLRAGGGTTMAADGQHLPLGQAVGEATIEDLTANGHLARFLDELFPETNTDDFEGTLVVEVSDGRVAAIALELGTQAGQFTTLPVTPLN